MTTPAILGNARQEVAEAPATRIWVLQYGPCWCRSLPTDSSSFDYVRLRRTQTDLGHLRESLLVVSERVIDGSGHLYRQVYEDVPDPKLVISTAACPFAEKFWDDLPNGWVPVEEMIQVDIHVDECIGGRPESLMAAVLRHAFSPADIAPDAETEALGLDV